MRKFMFALLILGMVPVVKADTFIANTAKNQRGEEVHPLYGGYSATRIAGSAYEQQVCTGRCLLGGVIMNTGPTTTRVFYYDTIGAGASATLIMSIMRFENDSGAYQERVPKPVRFSNGIRVRMSAGANEEEVTVLYVDLDAR